MSKGLSVDLVAKVCGNRKHRAKPAEKIDFHSVSSFDWETRNHLVGYMRDVGSQLFCCAAIFYRGVAKCRPPAKKPCHLKKKISTHGGTLVLKYCKYFFKFCCSRLVKHVSLISKDHTYNSGSLEGHNLQAINISPIISSRAVSENFSV